LSGKRLELLKEIIPKLSRVALPAPLLKHGARVLRKRKSRRKRWACNFKFSK
jgi:hypothetical protein